MKLFIASAAALALTVTGGAAGFFVARARSGSLASEDPNRPKLALRDGVQASEIGSGHRDVLAPDPRKYKPSYYKMVEPFTSNTNNSDAIVQLSLGVSTFYDTKVLDNFKDNELPIRSAIIGVLADEDPLELNTPAGKAALRRRLRDVVNATLVAKTGYGGIDDVYYTSLVSQ